MYQINWEITAEQWRESELDIIYEKWRRLWTILIVIKEIDRWLDWFDHEVIELHYIISE